MQRIFRAWSKARGRQNFNIVMLPDKDESFAYFYMEDVQSNSRVAFKLGTTLGNLNGLAISDFEGNCDSTLTCDWAAAYAKFVSDEYDRGLAHLLNGAIRLWRQLQRTTSADQRRTIKRYDVSEEGKLRKMLVIPTELKMVGRLTGRQVQFQLQNDYGNITVVMELGLNEDAAPVFSVISPRIALGGNVSFGGVIEYPGLTPTTWKRSYEAVPRLLRAALANARPDTYSDAEYYSDERLASREKFDSYKKYRGIVVHVSHKPLFFSPSLYKSLGLRYNSIVRLEGSNNLNYSPFVDKLDIPDTISVPFSYYNELIYEDRPRVSITVHNIVITDHRQDVKTHSRGDNFIEVHTDVFYDASSRYRSELVAMVGDRILILRPGSGLKKGEIGLSPSVAREVGNNITVNYILSETKTVNMLLVSQYDIHTDIRANLNDDRLVVSSKNGKATASKVYNDKEVPLQIVSISADIAKIAGVTSGDRADLSPPEDAIATVRVVLAHKKYSAGDIIEVSEDFYINNIKAGSSEYLTFNVVTLAGINGNYAVRSNPKIARGTIGLQASQLGNLSVSIGDSVKIFRSRLQEPAKVIVRPRAIFGNISGLYEAVRDSFGEYSVLTTGHTIPITVGKMQYDVDVFGIKDAKGHELHAAYMAAKAGTIGKEYLLEVIPSLMPTDTALDVPSYESSLEESSSEEEVSEYNYLQRPSMVVRELKPIFEPVYEAPESYEDETEEEMDFLPNEADEGY